MSATQAKDRQYALLAKRLNALSSAVNQSSELFADLSADLESMRTLAGLHAAQFMAVSHLLDAEENEQSQSQSERERASS
ncbi:hypothetical protein SISNIDRAFT_484617 [Sistotremastrum niveocremeum HHB9708]|uniref:Uncharacterized protein n=1 Tax=Sistotremastrum niveocremeum HHB9708 TaxID=1314777 RepID=A0A164VRB7_9AGAM|nr:hypothetical protein SISNIDRAFT_484617 [Sistotremastrum niveocremeum HHB9708]